MLLCYIMHRYLTYVMYLCAIFNELMQFLLGCSINYKLRDNAELRRQLCLNKVHDDDDDDDGDIFLCAL